ncbi:MAG: TetR family transcriptional regulator [Candidatus Methanoplasma sp.]|jgi:AcrR family transcriptional regulator|nr:TetR family transcriptional regulator [Candidatus Methanoplasma sp.]
MHQDKVDEIVQKTVELFHSTKGRGMTTRRIAKNAGINPAMVNYYFGSKEGLLRAAVSAMNGNHPRDAAYAYDGSRKAMFDFLVGICEITMLSSEMGISRDSASFSKDVMDTASKLVEMKTAHKKQGLPEEGDAASALGVACLLMTASTDPERFLRYSGVDMHAKNQLRALVSEQLDLLLEETL